MLRICVSMLAVAFTVLIQGCDDEKGCGSYRLTTQVDVQHANGGNATFIYNADGSLQKVSGRYQRDDHFFYDASGRLIRQR
jgi:hypothetical protein